MKKLMAVLGITALLMMGSITVSAETEGPLLQVLDPIPGEPD
ncbi:hypothetical protein [Virgibacillus doumboii]|nr:hypothetical protein [Virgibacillus doumboii]